MRRRISRGPVRPDPAFARIAERLRLLDLSSSSSEVDVLAEERFLDFYTKDGLLHAVRAYGLDEKLAAQGLSDFRLELHREDPFHHRLEVYVGDAEDDDHRVMDLRVHLRQLRFPETAREQEARFEVLVVEWLLMQNPRARFSRERPRLPGQRFPGTGLGRAVHNLLVIAAGRLHRDALIVVPERFHLARLYRRGGYAFPSAHLERELDAVERALSGLSFAAAAWAVERGCLRARLDGGDRPWRYTPTEMVLPISEELADRLPGLLDRLEDRLIGPALPDLEVDEEGLLRSLREDPVEGLDPDAL